MNIYNVKLSLIDKVVKLSALLASIVNKTLETVRFYGL
jgi:hypothetical protein